MCLYASPPPTTNKSLLSNPPRSLETVWALRMSIQKSNAGHYWYKEVDSEKPIIIINYFTFQPSSQCQTGETACHGLPDLAPISKKSPPRPKPSFTAGLYRFGSNLFAESSLDREGTEFSFVCEVAEGTPGSTDVLWESECGNGECDRCGDSETAYGWEWGEDGSGDMSTISVLSCGRTFRSRDLLQ